MRHEWEKESILMVNSSAWYKLHSRTVVHQTSVTTQSRLLGGLSVSMVICKVPHGADPSLVSVTRLCIFKTVGRRMR